MKFHGMEINDPKWIKAYWWIRVSITLLQMFLLTVLSILLAGVPFDSDTISLLIATIIIFGPIAWFIAELIYGSLWASGSEEGKEYLAKQKEKVNEQNALRERYIRDSYEDDAASEDDEDDYFDDSEFEPETFWFGLGLSKGNFYRFPNSFEDSDTD